MITCNNWSLNVILDSTLVKKVRHANNFATLHQTQFPLGNTNLVKYYNCCLKTGFYRVVKSEEITVVVQSDCKGHQ